jgi:hypothetical protein
MRRISFHLCRSLTPPDADAPPAFVFTGRNREAALMIERGEKRKPFWAQIGESMLEENYSGKLYVL